MLIEIILIVVGIAVVLWGADRFTDGASGLARRLKVSELVIGLTVVALGTSLPEFIVSFMSVLRGSGDMSVGNVVGSNIFNGLVVVGCSAILINLKVDKALLRRDIPLTLVASVLLLAFVASDNSLSRVEAVVLFAFFGIYSWVTYRVAMQDRRAAGEVKEETTPMPKLLLLIAVGIAALVVGGRVLVDNAAAVAREFHVSESVIGLTILAAGTSLPELVTSMVAARKGSEGLALGNALGSNIFNIVFVLGICGSVSPLTVTDITLVDWGMLVGSTLLLWLLAWTGKKLNRGEGTVLVCAYLAYLVWLLAR